MDGFGAGAFCGFKNAVDVEIRFGGGRGAYGIGFVGFQNVQCGTVEFRINCDRGNAEFVAGANEAHRNFATVRDQDFLEEFAHADSMLTGLSRSSGLMKQNFVL